MPLIYRAKREQFERLPVLNRGKTLATAKRGEITPEAQHGMMASGQELAALGGSLGGPC